MIVSKTTLLQLCDSAEDHYLLTRSQQRELERMAHGTRPARTEKKEERMPFEMKMTPWKAVYECGCEASGGMITSYCLTHGKPKKRVTELKDENGEIYELREDGTVWHKGGDEQGGNEP